MSKKLVIVESPAKAKTLSQFLGKGYSVTASVGHVRDLPQKELGVDIDNGFTPKYVVPRSKNKVLKDIREKANAASAVYLATDPDREGEAISWHIVQAAKLKDVPIKRVVFHEITQDAISDAFRHPRSIDTKLVDAQQARRILDRLVGYKLSPLLWKRVRRGLSAGRVQSVALKLIVDREAEITAFVPEEYWSIEADLVKEKDSSAQFQAALVGLVGGEKIGLKDEQQTKQMVSELEGATYTVSSVRQKKTARQPAPPFITSTLQQEAWRKLRFSAKQTMAIAQQLYEGLPLGKEGHVGLITYMRTDSLKVSSSAIAEARAYIEEKFGTDFLPPTPRRFTKKVKGAQEAHEAIRPTAISREPALVEPYLSPEQLKLYTLIWQRMVSSQLAAAQINTTTVDIEAKLNRKKYLFRATSSSVIFPGFLILYQEGKDDDNEENGKLPLPELTKGEQLRLLKLIPEQHFTQPPPHFTEATLVKTLEELGIGRPSTYAPILSLIQERGYVERRNRRLEPTELGTIISGLLSEHFADIINVGFTAQMEEKLDQIADGQLEWVPMLGEFYHPFEELVVKATATIPKFSEPTEELCEQCGRPMVIKWGRNGKFLSCSGFPECKNARTIETTGDGEASVSPANGEATDEICEKCGRPMVIKWGRWGKFLACSGYNDTNEANRCKNTKPILTTIGVKCPKCQKELVEKKSKRGRLFYGCSNYPNCDFASWDKPLPQPCPQCQGLLTQSKKGVTKCTQCDYEEKEVIAM
ncbi:MAG: type I DNA topoisomerase [Chloroflexota bacterium]|nr:type I DNA topoisomerase [Chloroflexota bacterium]